MCVCVHAQINMEKSTNTIILYEIWHLKVLCNLPGYLYSQKLLAECPSLGEKNLLLSVTVLLVRLRVGPADVQV